MRKYPFLMLVALGIVAGASASTPNEFQEVLGVRDATLIEMRVGQATTCVRLASVQIAECGSPDPVINNQSQRCKLFIEALVLNHKARIERPKSGPAKDENGFIIAYVFRDDGIFINQELLKRGLAGYFSAEDAEYDKILKQSAMQAQQSRIGIWSECTLIQQGIVATPNTNQPTRVAVALTPEPTPTPTPSPTPAPSTLEQDIERINQKYPVGPTWNYVVSWTGSGIKTTDTFTINASKWKIKWGNSSDFLAISAHDDSGDLVSVAANSSTRETGESIVHQSGTFYLEMNGLGQWNVCVEEYY